MDNIVDRAIYPMEEQKKEAESKRRMGLGLTGLANAIEAMGYGYGTFDFLETMREIMTVFRDEVYKASIELSKEKGPFPLFNAEEFLKSGFCQTLPEDIRDDIREYGIRNSHLLSIAPTGTISLSADNVSSGIEPVFSHSYDRKIQTFDGPIVEKVTDYAYREWGVEGTRTSELSVDDHINVLNMASYYVDSACSKTCNVGDDVTWDQFKEVYMKAYKGGASGCTTFRAAGKRGGILTEAKADNVISESLKDQEGAACYIDPETGMRSCE